MTLFLICLNAIAKVPKRSVASDSPKQVRGGSQPCKRNAVGSVVAGPKDLFSKRGKLELTLSYDSNVDEDGNTQYCYLTENNERSPTLHLKPGDDLILTIRNNTVAQSSDAIVQMQKDMEPRPGEKSQACGPATKMDSSTTNVHFHGTNVSPKCGEDEAIYTMINHGDSFTYRVHFPKDEPPGLYWYHPHVHGVAEPALLGGASGAIIVEGIQHIQRKTAALRERVLVLRDNLVPGNPKPGGLIPSWDLSLNYVPVPYPKYSPAIIKMRPNQRELWRVLNASADTIIDLQLTYDGVVQSLRVVGLDGVPTGSQDDNHLGTEILKNHIFLPPAARAEFIIDGPSKGIKTAQLSTLAIDTGPAGDNDPARTIASIQTDAKASLPPVKIPHEFHLPFEQRFEGVTNTKVSIKRKLYFSEVISNPADPASPTDFFITVDGAKSEKFSTQAEPAITTTEGTVEEWTIENRSTENHEFHIHQIHFLLTGRNGQTVLKDDQQFLDMVDIPYWSGDKKDPYPSVTLQMDFRGNIAGDFVYHCHILGHEDNGMMAKIRVLPRK